ncbi:hypothetical protein F5880DRAFT_1487205 [Lentinula raphanica]|nr:hypothetical protein F5880DRAFT_1487205 [Lentinula raphanica]
MSITSVVLLGAVALFGGLIGNIAPVNAQNGVATLPNLDLMSMKWIWSAEGAVPSSMRAFRRTLPVGRSRAVCVTFAIAADDAYTVWVNGVEIGDNFRKGGDPAGSAFRELDIYSVSLSHTKNVIAVNASNYVDVSGVIFTGVVLYEDGSQTSFVSDSEWVTAGPVSPPPRFQEIDFDDSKWVAATIYGPVGMGPWGPVHLGPFTGKVCGLSDVPHGNGGHHHHPDLKCAALLPLREGEVSPYWDLRHQIDCEILRLEEALFLCQKEKQKLIERLVIIIKEIGTLGGTDICAVVTSSSGKIEIGGSTTQIRV